MKTEQLLAIAIVAGIGIVLMKRFNKKTDAGVSNASGEGVISFRKDKVPCMCHGQLIGYTTQGKCDRLCDKSFSF